MPGDRTGIGHFFDLTAIYTDTDEVAEPVQPYTIAVEYSEVEKGPAMESTLALYWWDGNAWSEQGITSTVNVTDNLIIALVDHLSSFAVLGETNRVFLPIILRNN